MKTWLLAIAGCTLMTTSTAHADQCAWISAKQAAKAEAILAKQPKVIEYCEPCGETAPGAPYDVEDVTTATPQAQYKEIRINGKGVDLAYTFVQTKPTEYRNLAKLAGCPATDVSAKLTVADETPNGVIITPDPGPPPRTAEVTEPPIPAELPSPPPPPAIHTYYTTTIQHPMEWVPIALAAAGGFITGCAFTITAIALRRRRRAMRPRATDLAP